MHALSEFQNAVDSRVLDIIWAFYRTHGYMNQTPVSIAAEFYVEVTQRVITPTHAGDAQAVST